MKHNEIVERYLKVRRKDIAYIRYVFEGYEDFAIVTTIESRQAIVKLVIMPDFASDVDRLLMALHDEIDFSIIDGDEGK